MWAQIAMAAVNVLEGYGQAGSKRKLARAQYKLESGRADRKEGLRVAGNELAAATATLQRTEQSLQNQRIGRQAERDIDSSARSYTQAMDGLASDKFNTRLQAMNNVGQMAAEAAAAGVAGGSVEQVEQVERLRQARVEVGIQRGEENARWAKLQQDTAIMDQFISQTDTSAIFADLDYTAKDMVFNNEWQHKYSLGKAAMDGMNGFSGNMNNIGINASEWTAKQEKQGTTGFGGKSTMFSYFGGGNKGGTGANNQGLGGGNKLRL
ncbi:hypothetical protein BN110_002 [Yersinia phage phiR8-01]|uniref:Internal virion protein n=1 Tax=Yersinia phage phiR8-01 TaxID=1206556 RepID=I7K2J2_9CAUD|nr:internal virion protein [Yersinia phage phiR8-01]CCI88421.2 hypothetical protein BN110_002 [Yersinia phage phiR8-01]